MDHVALRAFVTVALEGNLTRAAERLHVTQPALSLQLKKLQDSLDVVLFERLPRGMRLTPAGRQLLPVAERVLAATRELRSAAADLKGQVSGRLRLGTIVDPEFLRLGACLRHLAERHPALTFELRHGMSGAISADVEAGRLDLGFALGAPGLADLRERFHVLALTPFTYRVVAPPRWEGQVLGKGWRELARLPWVGTPPESVHHRLLSRIAAAEGTSFHVVAQVDLEPSMMELVRSGVALSLARDSLALRAAHSDGVVVADGVEVPAELGLVCRPDQAHEPAVAAALSLIDEVWHGGRPSGPAAAVTASAGPAASAASANA